MVTKLRDKEQRQVDAKTRLLQCVKRGDTIYYITRGAGDTGWKYYDFYIIDNDIIARITGLVCNLLDLSYNQKKECARTQTYASELVCNIGWALFSYSSIPADKQLQTWEL